MSALIYDVSAASFDQSTLLPVVPTRGKIDPALDRILSDIARSDNASDPMLRNGLYIAYFPRARRILIRLWYRNLREFGCELDDLEQELFLIFVTLLERWSGNGSFSAYLHGAIPWRLFDAARRLATRERPVGDRQIVASAPGFSQSDSETVVLLEELARRLSPFDRDLLLWRIRDGKSLSTFAAERGMSQRTTRRAWLRLQQHLRRELAA